jgi:hypothetical protein
MAFTKCLERTSRKQYRALTRARLDFSADTITSYDTSATPQITPLEAVPDQGRIQGNSWETLEGALP